MYFGNHLLKIQIWYVVIQHTFFEKSWWNFVTRQITSKSSTDKCNLHSSRFPSQTGWSGYIMIASPIRVTRVWRWNCQVKVRSLDLLLILSGNPLCAVLISCTFKSVSLTKRPSHFILIYFRNYSFVTDERLVRISCCSSA